MLSLGFVSAAWGQDTIFLWRDKTGGFPPDQPVQVHVLSPQPVLEMEGFSASMAYSQGGWVGGALAEGMMSRRNRRFEGQVLALSKALEALDVEALLVEALQRHLPDALTLADGGVVVTQEVFSGSDDARRGPQHLHVMFDHYMTTDYRTIRISLMAASPREQPEGSRQWHYRQRVIFDISVDRQRAALGPRTLQRRVDMWSDFPPDALREQFMAGIDQVARMLAFDLPLNVPMVQSSSHLPESERHGRRRMLSDHEVGQPGGLLKVVEDREWVRLRGGLLWNKPID